MPVEFLTDQWVSALDAAARAAPGLATVTDAPLCIQQDVSGPDGDTTTYHLRLGGGTASVASGPAGAGAPVVRIRQDRATAAAIATGELSAQRAFMTGRLRIGGDLDVLLEHTEALTLLDDVFAEVRSQTVIGADVEQPPSGEGAGAGATDA